MGDWVGLGETLAIMMGGILGTELFKARFAPRVTKVRAEAEKESAVNAAVTGAIELRNELISGMSRDIKRLQYRLTRLEKRVNVYEAHIRSWHSAVAHADVSDSVREGIISRVTPLPDGYAMDVAYGQGEKGR